MPHKSLPDNDIGKSFVYIPPNSRMNFGSSFANPPRVRYEDRLAILNREIFSKSVMKLPKGFDTND